jgi:hypothetical protein
MTTWLGLRAFLHLHHAYSVAGDAEYLRRTYFFGVWLPGLGPFPRNVRMALLQIFGAFGAAWILCSVGWARSNRHARVLTAATIPPMVFLSLYPIPDRALAGFPWAVLIPAGAVASALPGGLIAPLLIVNAAFTMRMNAALPWLPPASVLLARSHC